MVVGDFPVKEKIAVVTGGGSGIGLALTKLLASKGAKVLIGDLKLTPEGEAFARENKNVRFTKCDVTKWSHLESLVSTSEKEFGDVPDIYCPVAGIFEPDWSNFWIDSEPNSYAQVDINVSHPIKLTRLAFRALLGRNKKGVVCCVASTAGLDGFYAAALYTATKHAIVGFVKSLGLADPDEGVKIVCICPGVVMTPLWTDRPEKISEYQVTDQNSLTPEQIAGSMLELIQEAKYSGGTVLKHDLGKKEIVFPGISDTDSRALSGATPTMVATLKEILKKERGGQQVNGP